ncbi:DIM1 family protein (nucleomorph) [Cryptomonas paramecium]|uniref:DIM1 family protein n=1 Tax=Cryptomonas paramaecium TaxID=2898 RepID=F2HI99_9CRYP|nr:DIM1 family protein [Cryptomonas paramecium]AEA39023.1 DIM1 family protein [Cryptomonas paramecium]|mmetsp:Transcript_46674/g.123873  ORF Transcript_46674/g.123873 Transcript_46674/m.123873 type:complete len:90 (-) Transcript_46674:4145-4414(-)
MKYLKSEYSLDQLVLDEENKLICILFNSNYQDYYFYKSSCSNFFRKKKKKNIVFFSVDNTISKSFNQIYEISKTFDKIYFYKNKKISFN